MSLARPTLLHNPLGLLLGLAFAALPLFGATASAVTLELRPVVSADDAEESSTGTMYLNSGDLELTYDKNYQTVGMRWPGVTIPPGATITAAWIQFTAKESRSDVTNLTIRGQAADNAAIFGTALRNISLRPQTAATISWAPVAWVSGEVGANQRTPELRTVIQEVVNRPGWASGNALAIIVSGVGRRTAWSWDGKRLSAPLLHVEYTTGPVPEDPPVAVLSVTQAASPALTVNASGAGSTDVDLTPIASYSFDFGDGTPAATTLAPTATTTHTYAAAGTYTVTLIVTDTGNFASTPATSTITVLAPPPDLPPVARLSVTQVASPPLTVSASGAASTDTDATPIASYQFNFGDGTPAVTTTAPTAVAAHTYADVGTYTVTLIATDTGGNASTPVTASITVSPPPADFPPVASLALTQAASPPLTVNASGAGSTDTDATPIASYRFDFGDGTPVVTTTAPTATATHTYAAAGTYTVTLIVTDTGSLASEPVTASITLAAGSTATFERRTTASSDDAEEFATGAMYLSSSDLELVQDSDNQTVGMRWTGVTIPPGAAITAAWIQFAAKESQSEVTNLTFRGQAAGNALTFATTSGNISQRPRTTAQTAWTPAAWTSGQVGANQRTPDLSGVIQEIVNQATWASGNALAIIVTGTGHRTAHAFDGSSTAAPLLHIEYSTGPQPEMPPVARLTVTQLSSPQRTVSASGAASTDTDDTPIATYRFDFGDGTPPVTTTAPTASTTHTYASTGTYTVTLIVTDTGGFASTPVTASITVSNIVGPPVAVYVGYYDTHHPGNTQPKPDPWMGSSGITFVGTPDSPSGGWDSSALRLDNLTANSVSVVVTVDIGSSRFALWGTRSIPPGGKLVLAQTSFENFDGSDTNPAGCYDCNPNLCLTQVQSTVPVVNVTIGGTTTRFYDTGQILNTHGVDGAGCPYTGERNDESHPWQQIFTTSASAQPPMADAAIQPKPGTVTAGTLALALPYPNPVRDHLILDFSTAVRGPVRLGVYDVAGRLVRMCVDRELEPGEYRNAVNLKGAQPGVYFCRLSTVEGTVHQSVILVP